MQIPGEPNSILGLYLGSYTIRGQVKAFKQLATITDEAIGSN